MKFNRIFSATLAVVLLISCLLMGGCSTPEYALEVDGKKYTTADYLAYVYNALLNDSTSYTYLYYYGAKALDMKVPYDKDTEMPLREYVLLRAQDTMIRQVVLEEMLKENGLSWDEEDLKELEKNLAELGTDAFLDIGFNNQRYIDMVKAVSLNETSLFYGLYGEGGSREVAQEDLRKYFDDNYLSYKIIEISLTNSNGSEMSDEDIAKINTRLQGYLDAFNGGEKTGTAFDKTAYAQYVADEEAAAKKEKADGDAKEDSEDTSDTEPSAQRYDAFKDYFSDEDLRKAVEAVEEGTAGIQTYQKNGTTKTMALIFRMDPESERYEEDKDGNQVAVEDYYGDMKDTVLQYMKYEEFDEEIKKAVDELGDKVIYHKRALNAPDLEEMLG